MLPCGKLDEQWPGSSSLGLLLLDHDEDPNSWNYSPLGITSKKTGILRNTAVTTSHLEHIQGHTVNLNISRVTLLMFRMLSPMSLNTTVVSFKNNYGRSLQDRNIVRPYPVLLSLGWHLLQIPCKSQPWALQLQFLHDIHRYADSVASLLCHA